MMMMIHAALATQTVTGTLYGKRQQFWGGAVDGWVVG